MKVFRTRPPPPQHCQLLLRVDAGLDLPELIRMMAHFASRAVAIICRAAGIFPPQIPSELRNLVTSRFPIESDPPCAHLTSLARYDIKQIRRSLATVIQNEAVQDVEVSTSDAEIDGAGSKPFVWCRQARRLHAWLDGFLSLLTRRLSVHFELQVRGGLVNCTLSCSYGGLGN